MKPRQKNFCEHSVNCQRVNKHADKPDRCRCRDLKCRKKKKDCATRGKDIDFWGCRDGQECVAGVKNGGETWKWGKCRMV